MSFQVYSIIQLERSSIAHSGQGFLLPPLAGQVVLIFRDSSARNPANGGTE